MSCCCLRQLAPNGEKTRSGFFVFVKTQPGASGIFFFSCIEAEFASIMARSGALALLGTPRMDDTFRWRLQETVCVAPLTRPPECSGALNTSNAGILEPTASP